MAKVWRYPIQPGLNEIMMPAEAKVVHVGTARGEASVWVLVNEWEMDQMRRFLAVGTGETIPSDRTYLGTFEPEPGLFFHLFE